MLRRPWPIVILVLFHLIAPVFNVLNSVWMSRTTVERYLLYKLDFAPWWDLLALFALVPIAGLVIYACKRWSYFVYMVLMSAVALVNYINWQSHPGLFHLPLLLAFMVLNIVVVGYFLIPEVRTVYFNERLRWWEADPRYVLQTQGTLVTHEQYRRLCDIENLSRSGAMVAAGLGLEKGNNVSLVFDLEGTSFQIRGTIVHETDGYVGIQFHHTPQSKRQLTKFIRQVVAKKYQLRNVTPPLWNSFVAWANSLIYGQGWVPQVQRAPVEKND